MPSIVAGGGPDGPTVLQDLLVLITAPLTVIISVFTLVLYAHYRHLHSAANHLLMVALAALGVLSGVVFIGIFGFGQTSSARFSQDNCIAQGVLHTWLLQIVHTGVAVHWWILAVLVKWRLTLPTNTGPLILSIVVMVLCAGTACLSLLHREHISYNGQSWCESRTLWFVWVFEVGAVAVGVVGMVVAVVGPLRHSAVNADQKSLMLRRLALSVLWVLVSLYETIVSSITYDGGGQTRGLKTFQSALLPLSGVLLALVFLLPERMLTVRALGLPPGVDPPYGFTSTMKVVPDKICRGQSYYQPSDDSRRDPFAFHNIDLEASPLVSPAGGFRRVA